MVAFVMLTISEASGQNRVYRVDSVLNNPLLLTTVDYEYFKIIVAIDDSFSYITDPNKNDKFVFVDRNDSLLILKILKKNKTRDFLIVDIHVIPETIVGDSLKVHFSKSYTTYNMFRGNTFLKIKRNPVLNIDLILRYEKNYDIWRPFPF